MDFPARKSLPHEIPLWVDPRRAVYFITICCRPRGGNHLAYPLIATELIATIQHRNQAGHWHAQLGLFMLDHVHLLLSFPEAGKPLQTVVSKWKERTAKMLGVNWQHDFFEHRLRKEESLREKADYILANPVRAGLVSAPEDWPYRFIGER